MSRVIFFCAFLIFTLLHIICFPPTITAESLVNRFLNERSPILNSKPNIPNFREKGGINRATPDPPSISLSLPTDASLDHQGNVAAEATTKVTMMVHSTVYGVKQTGKPSVGDKSSGNEGVKIVGGREGSWVLTGVLVGIVCVFLKSFLMYD